MLSIHFSARKWKTEVGRVHKVYQRVQIKTVLNLLKSGGHVFLQNIAKIGPSVNDICPTSPPLFANIFKHCCELINNWASTEFQIKTVLNLLKSGGHVSCRILRKLVRPIFPPGHSLHAQLLINSQQCLKMLANKGGEVGQMSFTDGPIFAIFCKKYVPQS
jgi:hypothetical protein